MVSWVRCDTWLYRFLIFANFYFVLASHRYCSIHCVEEVDILEKKKAELQKLPLPRAVFLEGVINPDKSMPYNYG